MSSTGPPGPPATAMPADPLPPTSPQDGHGTGGRRPALALVFSITVTGILANTLITPAIPDILDDLGVGNSSAGLLVAVGTFPGIAMAPLIGLLADRYGRRRVLLPCLVGFGVFGLASALAPSFEALIALRLLQGVGSAGLINLAVVIIGDHWTGVDRARALGRNAAVLTVSLAVFPPLGGLLTELGGWRLAFLPYATGLVTAAVIGAQLPRVTAGTGTAMGSQVSAAMGFVRRPLVLGSIGTGFVVFLLIFGLFLTTLPIHLEERFDLGAGLRGLVLAAPAVTSTLAALCLGRARARFGARRLLLWSTTVFALAFAAIGVAPALVLLVAAALLYGLGEGLVIPTLQDVVAGVAPASSRGAVVAVWVGAARAGQTVGPLAAGFSLAHVGTGATFVAGGAVAAALLGVQLAVRRLPAPA